MPKTIDFPEVTTVGSNDYLNCIVDVGGGIFKDKKVKFGHVPDFTATPIANSALAAAGVASAQAGVAVATANAASVTATGAANTAVAASGTALTALGVANAADAKTDFSTEIFAPTTDDYVHLEGAGGVREKVRVDRLFNGTVITSAGAYDRIPIIQSGNNSIAVADLFAKPVLLANSTALENEILGAGMPGADVQCVPHLVNASIARVDSVSGYDGTNTYTPGVSGVYRVVVEITYEAWDTNRSGYIASFWAGVMRNGIIQDMDYIQPPMTVGFDYAGTQPSMIARCETYVTLDAADSIQPFGMFVRQDSRFWATSYVFLNRVKMMAEMAMPVASVSSSPVVRDDINSNLRAYWAEDFSGKIIAEWDCSGTGAFGTSNNTAYIKWGNTEAVAFASQPAGIAKQSGTLTTIRGQYPLTHQSTPYQEGGWDASNCLIYVVGDAAGVESTPWLITHLPYAAVI